MMDAMTRITDQAYRVTIDERISELWRWRRWYRAHAMTLTWPVRADNMAELRALVKLARKARRASEPIGAQNDPVTLAAEWSALTASTARWTENESRYAHGDR